MSELSKAVKRAIELIESGDFEPVRGTYLVQAGRHDLDGNVRDVPCGCVRGAIAHAAGRLAVDHMLREAGIDPSDLEDRFEGWGRHLHDELLPAPEAALALLREIAGDDP